MTQNDRLTPQGVNEFYSDEPFKFISGETIACLKLVYETFGTLNERKDNVILIHHALSTSSHVSSHAGNTEPGWWEAMVGSGKAIDTDRFFVVCINNLGSCFGSTCPMSINPETGKPYHLTFPNLQLQDIVHAQALLLDKLSIDKCHAVLSASMGAMISLCWAVLYPERVARFISISSCYKSYPTTRAFRAIQRDVIRLDPSWKRGEYQPEAELPGFVLARKLGHLSYRSAEELEHRFVDENEDLENKQGIESYLQYNAEKFTSQFDANCYLALTNAMDQFDVSTGFNDLTQAFACISAKTLVISVSSDNLFLPYQQRELYELLKNAEVDVQLIEHQSEYGHDAFLLEIEPIGEYIKTFLR